VISLWILFNTGIAFNVRQISRKRALKPAPKSLDLASCQQINFQSPTASRRIQRVLESQSLHRDNGDSADSSEEIILQLESYFRAMHQANRSSHEDITRMAKTKIVRSLKRFLDSITQQVKEDISMKHSLMSEIIV
jgi:hypothetical protein